MFSSSSSSLKPRLSPEEETQLVEMLLSQNIDRNTLDKLRQKAVQHYRAIVTDWLRANKHNTRWEVSHAPNLAEGSINLLFLAATCDALDIFTFVQKNDPVFFEIEINRLSLYLDRPLLLHIAITCDSSLVTEALIKQRLTIAEYDREFNKNLVLISIYHNALEVFKVLQDLMADEVQEVISRCTAGDPLSAVMRSAMEMGHAEIVVYLLFCNTMPGSEYYLSQFSHLIREAISWGRPRVLNHLFDQDPKVFKELLIDPSVAKFMVNHSKVIFDLKLELVIEILIENDKFGYTWGEIATANDYFTAWFEAFYDRIKSEESEVNDKKEFAKKFSLLLKYAAKCEPRFAQCQRPNTIPPIFEICRQMANIFVVFHYPLTKSIERRVGDLQTTVFLTNIAVEYFPPAFLEPQVSRVNFSWVNYIATVQGIETNDCITAKEINRKIQRKVSCILYGKIAAQIADAVYAELKEEWVGLTQEYRPDMRRKMLDVVAERDGRFVIFTAEELEIVKNKIVDAINEQNSPSVKITKLKELVNPFLGKVFANSVYTNPAVMYPAANVGTVAVRQTPAVTPCIP